MFYSNKNTYFLLKQSKGQAIPGCHVAVACLSRSCDLQLNIITTIRSIFSKNRSLGPGPPFRELHSGSLAVTASIGQESSGLWKCALNHFRTCFGVSRIETLPCLKGPKNTIPLLFELQSSFSL